MFLQLNSYTILYPSFCEMLDLTRSKSVQQTNVISFYLYIMKNPYEKITTNILTYINSPSYIIVFITSVLDHQIKSSPVSKKHRFQYHIVSQAVKPTLCSAEDCNSQVTRRRWSWINFIYDDRKFDIKPWVRQIHFTLQQIHIYCVHVLHTQFRIPILYMIEKKMREER